MVRYMVLILGLIVVAPGTAWADIPPWLTCGGCRTPSGAWGVLFWFVLIAVVTFLWSCRRKR